MINDENDEATLHLGSEDEEFKSIQSDSPSKGEEREHPYMIGARKAWMRIKAHEYVEAMRKRERYSLPEREVEMKKLYDVLRDEHSLTEELYRTLKEIHGHFLEDYCETRRGKKGQSTFQAIQEAIEEMSRTEDSKKRSTSTSSTQQSQGEEILSERWYEEKITEMMKDRSRHFNL